MSDEKLERERIDAMVCDILVTHGPDGHVDGHECLTDYGLTLLEQGRQEGREEMARVLGRREAFLRATIEALAMKLAGVEAERDRLLDLRAQEAD